MIAEPKDGPSPARRASGALVRRRPQYPARRVEQRIGERWEARDRGRVRCQVSAPPLVLRKPGERIKTDRRDARKLAELHRAGLLTVVRAPTPAEEAVRDLCRPRDDVRADRRRCRHRLSKLLLRRGLHYTGQAWTRAHWLWIDGLTWPHPAERIGVDDYLLAVDHLDAPPVELDPQLEAVAQADPYREPVGWLRCFRGIDTLSAVPLLAELHDVQRFPTARALMDPPDESPSCVRCRGQPR